MIPRTTSDAPWFANILTPANLAEQLPIRPVAGVLVTAATTWLAVAILPLHPESKGALLWPALIMGIGLMLVPVSSAIQSPKTILRGEHLLLLSLIFWLLLDLIQGAY